MEATLPVSQETHQPLPHKTTGDIQGTNFPMDGEGRVYHLALKAGELANDIIIVGDPNRAAIVSEFLKPDPNLPDVFPHTCNRGFYAYTGYFKDHRISVVSIGMGITMVDFFVREARAIVTGQMRIIRLGSCGTPQENISVGTVVAAKFSFGIFEDPRPFEERLIDGSIYTISNAISPDAKLHESMMRTLTLASNKGAFSLVEAGIAATDYFYNSQGRQDPAFPDDNLTLIEDILKKHPETGGIEMEASKLFDLAHMNTAMAKQGEGISAAVCAIVLAARKTGIFLSHDEKHQIEKLAGKACLKAFI